MYDWVDSIEKMNSEQSPKKMKSIISYVSIENVTEAGIINGKNVWNTFECKIFRNYSYI